MRQLTDFNETAKRLENNCRMEADIDERDFLSGFLSLYDLLAGAPGVKPTAVAT